MAKIGTLGVIIGNRDLFPGHLAEKGRKEILDILKKQGIEAIVLPINETEHGGVKNLEEAKKYAKLFRKNRDIIDGILVSLPNFGDERAIADTIKMSELNVPVLIHAYPDELEKMGIDNRRDSFCGKLSTCCVLSQYGIHFSLTDSHTISPNSAEFIKELNQFIKVCHVVNKIRKVRIGAIGARVTPFKTVRYSEKILEGSGISVETIDLSEIIMAVEKLKDSNKEVHSELNAIIGYCPAPGVPQSSLLTMAKLGVILEKWVKENDINALALQCWEAMQESLHIFPCVIMSMMSNSFMPSACEVDVMGALSMYALQLASGQPSALFDWNNNYGDDPNKLVFFHCSNLPKAIMKNANMSYNEIIAKKIGRENSYGTCVGRVKAGPMTFLRISTNDREGKFSAIIGEGEFTNDTLKTFGGVGVAKIPGLQRLLHMLCENGFEHHVAITPSSVSKILFEAINKYLGWNVYRHNHLDET